MTRQATQTAEQLAERIQAAKLAAQAVRDAEKQKQLAINAERRRRALQAERTNGNG